MPRRPEAASHSCREFVVSTTLPLSSSIIFGYLTHVVNDTLREYKYRLTTSRLETLQDSLKVLIELENMDSDSEGFITDMALIFTLSNYCHHILYAVLTVGVPCFFHQV